MLCPACLSVAYSEELFNPYQSLIVALLFIFTFIIQIHPFSNILVNTKVTELEHICSVSYFNVRDKSRSFLMQNETRENCTWPLGIYVVCPSFEKNSVITQCMTVVSYFVNINHKKTPLL